MQSYTQKSSNKNNPNRIRHHYYEFLGLLAKRHAELHEGPIQSRWDLGRVGADPYYSYEKSIRLLELDYDDANRFINQRDKLLQIKSAIHRMREGVYGLCIRCCSNIDLADLRKKPEEGHCFKCLDES